MRAYCGLECGVCKVYLATVRNNDNEREKVAKEWSQKYGWSLIANDINCRGCTQKGREIFGYCNKCEVRHCTQQKDIVNCSECPEAICEKLDKLCEIEPKIRRLIGQLQHQE